MDSDEEDDFEWSVENEDEFWEGKAEHTHSTCIFLGCHMLIWLR